MLSDSLKLISPKAPACETGRIGGKNDGGYIMLPSLLNGSVAYSLGVGEQCEWDIAMAEKGYQIYMYDHTVESPPTHHSNFHFHKSQISSEPAANQTTIQSALDTYSHGGLDDIILKCDIEGAEWGVFSQISQNTLSHFSQIIIEFHSICQVFPHHIFRAALQNLTKQFVPFHVHGNNWSSTMTVNEKLVPNVIEVSYVRKDLVTLTDEIRYFPTKHDAPNHPDLPEIVLGTFQW